MSEQQTGVTYGLVLKVQPTHARTLIRNLNKLLRLYTENFELRVSPLKNGSRLTYEGFHADLQYAYEAKTAQFSMKARFKEGCPNKFIGRVIALYGALLEYFDRTDGKYEFLHGESQLFDLATVRKWGKWALKELKTAYPADFKEITL